jgi:hypothetical protein
VEMPRGVRRRRRPAGSASHACHLIIGHSIPAQSLLESVHLRDAHSELVIRGVDIGDSFELYDNKCVGDRYCDRQGADSIVTEIYEK